MDSFRQGLYTSSGVVLRRNIQPEGNINIYVFLKEIGPVWLNAPGSAKGKVRFGGATEPLTWGIFQIYKGTKRFYLKSVEVKDDIWLLKKNYEAVKISLQWLKLLSRNLLEAHPDDKLLGILYWSFILLVKNLDPEMVNWRFCWKWLNLWGIAPDLTTCPGCGNLLSRGIWSTEAIYCSSCLSGRPENEVQENILKVLGMAAMFSHESILKEHSCFTSVRPEIWRLNSRRLLEALERMK